LKRRNDFRTLILYISKQQINLRSKTMADIGTFHSEKTTAGDAAVNGLLNGMLAGAVMAAYLIVALGISGESLVDVLSRFGSANGAMSPLVGAVSHLAMSAIYGIGFALIWRWIARRSQRRGLALVGGLIYAGFLFTIAELILLPAAGSPLLDIPLHFGIGHAIYGVTLGLFTRRS
jgi:hypothetical protein